MKMRFLASQLLLLLAMCSSLQAYQPPQGYIHIACTIEPIDRDTESRTHPHIPGPKPTDSKLSPTQATSTNWAGYVAASNLDNPVKNSVSAVYGSWTVPSVSPSKKNTYCAIWIGIDGYTNGTVEQIGTSHDFSGGAQRHYAWFEMYPGPSHRINGFPLNVGDSISASVEYSGNGIFTMRLYNNTQHIVTTVPTSQTKSLTAERSCAEWIVEAPWLNKTLPLSNFGTAFLSGCMANINGTLTKLNNLIWPHLSLTMVKGKAITKALPSALGQDNQSFSVTWHHQ